MFISLNIHFFLSLKHAWNTSSLGHFRFTIDGDVLGTFRATLPLQHREVQPKPTHVNVQSCARASTIHTMVTLLLTRIELRSSAWKAKVPTITPTGCYQN